MDRPLSALKRFRYTVERQKIIVGPSIFPLHYHGHNLYHRKGMADPTIVFLSIKRI